MNDLIANRVNNAFSAQNVANSAARVSNLRNADFLTLSRELGILPELDAAGFRQYRRRITIPRVIQRILTLVHREALFRDTPIPINIRINDTETSSIQVTVTEQLISVTLNRPAPTRPGAASRRAR